MRSSQLGQPDVMYRLAVVRRTRQCYMPIVQTIRLHRTTFDKRNGRQGLDGGAREDSTLHITHCSNDPARGFHHGDRAICSTKNNNNNNNKKKNTKKKTRFKNCLCALASGSPWYHYWVAAFGKTTCENKEIGTIRQINVMPINKIQFIAGKLTPFAIIGLFELAFGLIVGKLLFNIPMEGSLWLVFLSAGVYLFVIFVVRIADFY